MSDDLTDAQRAKLKAMLNCVDINDFHKFHTLVEHAENIDEVMRTVDSLGRVGFLFKKTVLYIAGMLVAVSLISGHLTAWIKGFLIIGK